MCVFACVAVFPARLMSCVCVHRQQAPLLIFSFAAFLRDPLLPNDLAA